MSTFRKTVLTTAIIGAGLATTAGSAFATTDCSSDHHGSNHHETSKSSGCSNDVTQLSKTSGHGGGRDSLVDVLGGAQTAAPINACHVLDNNKVLNNIHVSAFDGVL